jgi:hypothetical protein
MAAHRRYYTGGKVPRPIVRSIWPATGFTGGGDRIVLRGNNFFTFGDMWYGQVKFGNAPATNVVWTENDKLVVISPPGRGIVKVVVSFGGASSRPVWFTYTKRRLPVIRSLDPLIGLSSGGDQVTINGLRLAKCTEVLFGTANALDFDVISDSKIVSFSPPGLGPTHIRIKTKQGVSVRSGATRFTYCQPRPPLITKLRPRTGYAGGGDAVEIVGKQVARQGSSFPGTQVFFGDTSAKVKAYGDTFANVVSPPGRGTVHVRIRALGLSTPSAKDQFTYTNIPRPSVTGVTDLFSQLELRPIPHAMPNRRVLIAGNRLAGATSVTFAGVEATGFRVLSATRIIAVSPPKNLISGISMKPINVRVTTKWGVSPVTSASWWFW